MTQARLDLSKAIDKLLEWSVYLIVFAIPFSKSVIEISISVGIVLLVIKKIRARDYTIKHTPANLPLLFIFFTAFISLYNSQYMGLSLRALISKNLKFIMLYLLVVEVIDDKTKMMNLLKMAALSCALVFIDVFIQHFITYMDIFHLYPSFKYRYGFDIDPNTERYGYHYPGFPTGPFPFPNDLAAWMLIVLPVILLISIYSLKNKPSSYYLVALSVAGLYIFSIVKVRGAWLAFVLALVSSAPLIKKKFVVIAIFLLLAVFIASSYAGSLHLILGLSTVLDRGDMWAIGFKMFKEHPIIGNGINTFFNKFKEMRQDEWRGLKGSYAHNCYLQMAADTGMLGLAAFVWFVVSIMRSAVSFIIRTNDRLHYALALGLVLGIGAFLIHSFIDTNLYSLNLATLFWLSAGLLASISELGKMAHL